MTIATSPSSRLRVSAPPCAACARRRARRAARGHRTVHQPGLLVLSARRQAARRLARDPSLVALSLPVDYWDYLGWKDTLALHGHSNRQRAYAEARGDREVYTPQVVVNGMVHVLGSDKAAIEHAIAQTRQSAAPLTLPVTLTVADGKVTVNVPAATGGEHAAPKSGSARSPEGRRSRSAAARTAATR